MKGNFYPRGLYARLNGQKGERMEVIDRILTENPCYKAGKKITVKGLMLHSVGCPQPSAEVFVRNWNNAQAARACVHAFIDGNTGKVYQTLPWDYRAWHCGGNGNNTHIGVEMCEPSCIKYTGGASFSCSNHETAVEVVKRTYDAAVELFAFLCKRFGLNPMEDGVIISHKEGHDRGKASGHGDPEHLWGGLSSGYTMDGFRSAVREAMGAAVTVQAAAPVKQEASLTAAEGRDMTVSLRGVELIAQFEGCRLEAYKCPAGVWTIGYGHTAGVKQGDKLASKEAAMELLKEDVQKYGSHVNQCVKKGLLTFPLTQNQFDALASFCYNCGSGSLQKLVSGRDAAVIADKLLLYNKGGGKVLAGLTRRREEERALFLS